MGSYFYQALCVMLDTPPPEELMHIKSIAELTEVQWDVLQAHAVDHSKLEWATGISIIEAAESIVDDAISNANIKSK